MTILKPVKTNMQNGKRKRILMKLAVSLTAGATMLADLRTHLKHIRRASLPCFSKLRARTGDTVLSGSKSIFVNMPDDQWPFLSVELEKIGFDADFYALATVDEWSKILPNYRVLVAGHLPEFISEVLEKCKGLKMIQRFGIGCDDIPIELASRKGIFVCNIPEAMAESVAEHVWALTFALFMRVLEGHTRILEGKWTGVSLGGELWGKTLGIVGFGNIGKRVTGIGRALDMRILAYSRTLSKITAQLFAAERVDLSKLLRESDVVVVTVPLTEETSGIIGEKELNLMKKTAFIINVSRGRVIQEEALVKALQNGIIGGAGLDVYDKEPLPEDTPLRRLKNVVLTPHIASHTVEAFTKTSEAVAENVARLLKNERPRWIVNAENLRKHGYLE